MYNKYIYIEVIIELIVFIIIMITKKRWDLGLSIIVKSTFLFLY